MYSICKGCRQELSQDTTGKQPCCTRVLHRVTPQSLSWKCPNSSTFTRKRIFKIFSCVGSSADSVASDSSIKPSVKGCDPSGQESPLQMVVLPLSMSKRDPIFLHNIHNDDTV